MTELVVNNLHVFRGERHVLRGVSLAVSAGCCLQVTGVNGAGKTTLLRSLCGFIETESAELFWRGRHCAFDDLEYHAELGYLGHEAPLKGDLNAAENLRFAVGLRRKVASAEISTALAEVGAAAFADRPVRRLSAGQRRRVAFAQLKLAGSRLWLLDEPTTNLDVAGQQMVAGLLTRHLAAGGLVIAATHQALQLEAGLLERLELGVTS
jgi:heme exporter protein A